MTGLSQEYIDLIGDAIREGDEEACLALMLETLEKGFRPIDILDQGLVPAIGRVGDLFEEGNLFLPELMMAGKAMKAAVGALTQPLEETFGERGSRPLVVLGTVEGDLHEIGKNIVGIMLETAGFKVVDLGMDVRTEAFVEAATLQDARIVGASALLTTTMEKQRELVKELKQADPAIKIMVGGAPVTEDWAKEIGADGYAENAHDAVKLAKRLEKEYRMGDRIS
jgi:5-methyltetrahydrofolate--homocysteine methyltransferase